VRIADLSTPALLVDRAAFDHNVSTMAATWPGDRLRPHVKAFKSTAMARQLVLAGHRRFCGATPRELIGMAEAGLGHDLLLANETVDRALLRAMTGTGARVTVAVDSDETITAAAHSGIREVLIDVNVGMPRCGCAAADAGLLADRARVAGLAVRGVMGYEGHVVGLEDRVARRDQTEMSMEVLLQAHDLVGGEVVSGGGTGTWDTNRWVTELQAGSYTLMDTAYAKLDLPFRQALSVLGTVISTSTEGWAVADVGLKALAMDHGNPTMDGASVWYCADEHIVFSSQHSDDAGPIPRGDTARHGPHRVGTRVLVWPAHVDPTVAKHRQMHVIEGPVPSGTGIDPATEIIDHWPIDLRHW